MVELLSWDGSSDLFVKREWYDLFGKQVGGFITLPVDFGKVRVVGVREEFTT